MEPGRLGSLCHDQRREDFAWGRTLYDASASVMRAHAEFVRENHLAQEDPRAVARRAVYAQRPPAGKSAPAENKSLRGTYKKLFATKASESKVSAVRVSA